MDTFFLFMTFFPSISGNPSGKASAPLVLAAFTAEVRSLKVWNAAWASRQVDDTWGYKGGEAFGAKECQKSWVCVETFLYTRKAGLRCVRCVYVCKYKCICMYVYVYLWTRFRNAMRSHACICTGAHRCWPLPRIWGIPNLYIHSEWFEDNRISNACSPDLHNRQEKSSGTSVLEGLRDNNQHNFLVLFMDKILHCSRW